jgi:hypothetical protein
MSATEPQEEVELNWDDPALRSTQLEYDPDADMNLYRLPPDTEDYLVMLRLGEKGVYPKQRLDKEGRKIPGEFFAVAELELVFVAPGEWFDGRKACTEYLNTIKQASSDTNAFVNLLRLLGERVPSSMSLPELAEKFKEVIGAEPKIGARFKWQAQSRDVQDAWKNKDDENHAKFAAQRYKEGVFTSGMKNFPKDDSGNPNPEVKDPITDVEVRARLKLEKFIQL